MVDLTLDICGVDLSLTSTGVATPEALYAIQVKTKGEERVADIVAALMSDILSMDHPYIVIEGYAFAKRSSHSFAQGELGGVLKHYLFQNKIPYVDIPPTVRAKFATGRGNAGKSEVVSHVTARSGQVFTGRGADDMADAWVLREMGLQHFSQSSLKWPAKNLEALESVDWLEV